MKLDKLFPVKRRTIEDIRIRSQGRYFYYVKKGVEALLTLRSLFERGV